jgi:hypothetical protein
MQEEKDSENMEFLLQDLWILQQRSLHNCCATIIMTNH